MKDPMNYTKARGILLAKKFLPNVVPFTDVVVVQTVEEWEEIKDQYGDFVAYRCDTQLGRPRKNITPGTNGFTDSLLDLIRKVNREDPEGAVLIMPTKEPAVPRYEYGGGFNIVFHPGHSITIEAVSKGFDGHELTRGLAVHERMQIPWSQIGDPDASPSEWWGKEGSEYWWVEDETYVQQRQARIDFLCNDCHYDRQLVEQHIPHEFYPALDEHLLEDVVIPLAYREAVLAREGLHIFAVQGNLVQQGSKGYRPQVWEIFQP